MREKSKAKGKTDDQTPFQQYLERRKEKRREKKHEAREKRALAKTASALIPEENQRNRTEDENFANMEPPGEIFDE